MTIAPTNDMLFRKAFASPQHKEVTIGLITDVLALDVKSLEIENPYDIREFTGREGTGVPIATEVDVLARLGDQSLVEIEIQVRAQPYYLQRALFYVCSRYVADYGRTGHMRQGDGRHGDKYSSLYPTFGINICDFELFGTDTDALRSFSLYDNAHKAYLGGGTRGLLSLSFLELGKRAYAKEGNLAHWMAFFKDGKVAPEAPAYIREACTIVDFKNLSSEEREMISAKEKAEADRIGQLNFAWNKGRSEGVAEGRAKGVAKGRSEGMAEGRAKGRSEGMAKGRGETQVTIARNLRAAGLAPDVIAQSTGLSIEEVEGL
jgi:predicted transposase/invertase (TIGR01784 family)